MTTAKHTPEELYLISKYFKKITLNGGCWIWNGAKTIGRIRNGKGKWYGRITLHRKNMTTQRVFYELFKGKIPQGLEIDHLCRNTLCCNPAHLEAVTHAENVRRGTAGEKLSAKAKLITHCPQGHEYTKENTYLYRNQRHCKACTRIRSMEYQRRKSTLNREIK